MGWIISTCILGALLLFVVVVCEYDGIMDLRKEIACKNTLISQKEEIERLQNDIIAQREVRIAQQEVIIELLRERIQEQRQLIDRLTNMNAPQPIMEPQIMQNVVA